MALAGTIFTGFGAAVAGVLLSSQGQSLSTGRVSALQNTFLAGFHAAFLVCAAFAAIGIFTSLVRGNENKNRQRQPLGNALDNLENTKGEKHGHNDADATGYSCAYRPTSLE